MPTQTDVITLVTGNTYIWEHRAELVVGGVPGPWDLTGGVVDIIFRKPDRNAYTFAMTMTDDANGVSRYSSPADFFGDNGDMTVAFEVRIGGVVKRSLPFTYTIVHSP